MKYTKSYILGQLRAEHRHKQRQFDSIHDLMPLHRKLLYMVFLDSVATRAQLTATTSQGRFLELIDAYSSWKDRSRVSTPQLYYILNMRKHSKSKLYQDVADRLERWKIGNQYPIVADEFEHKLLPSTRSNDIKTAIRHCSLDHLLYQYRNSLVHEFISPAGVTSDDPTITEPFYYSLQGGGLATAKPWYTWELVVPVEFLKLLVQAVLNNLNSERINNPFNWKDLLKPPKYQRRRMFPWRKF